MSAVAERASLQELQQALAHRKAEVEKLTARIDELRREEAETRDAELRQHPGKRFYGGATSKGERLRQECAKCERRLESVGLEITTLTELAEQESAAAAAEELAEATKRAAKLTKAEDAIWRRGGDLLAAFVNEWNALADTFEAREALRAEVESARVAERATDADAVAEWQTAIEFPNGRLPVDLGAFVEMLIELGLDPRRDGHRPQVDEIIARHTDSGMRPEGEPEVKRTLVESSSRRYPARLARLVPDLRGQDKRVSVSGNTSRVSTFGTNSAGPGTSFGVR